MNVLKTIWQGMKNSFQDMKENWKFGLLMALCLMGGIIIIPPLAFGMVWCMFKFFTAFPTVSAFMTVHAIAIVVIMFSSVMGLGNNYWIIQKRKTTKMTYVILRILKPDTSPYSNMIQSHSEMNMRLREDVPAEAISIGIGIHKVEEFVMGPVAEVERYIRGVNLLKRHDQHWAYEDGKKAIE